MGSTGTATTGVRTCRWDDGSVARSPTVVVLYGPKAVGKSWVAEVLQQRAGVHHVDADELVLDLLEQGVRPDPELGWLGHVEGAVQFALDRHRRVSVEATGAWDSDGMLADRLIAGGVRVVAVWVTTPLEVTLDRLSRRSTRKVVTTPQQARWIHARRPGAPPRGASPPRSTPPASRTPPS
jgi:chloramphenicol 3-O-phosphotransferase